MTIDMVALQDALKELNTLTYQELEFPVGPTTITLRQLTPGDETAVQRYAQAALPDDPDAEADRASFSEYLDRFKVGTCSHAILAIGKQRLVDDAGYPTDKKTAGGVPITVTRDRYIREAILQWPRPWLSAIFRKYGELLNEAERRVSNAIEFAPSDLKTEIAQAEERVADLKLELESREEAEKDTMTEHIRELIEQDAKQPNAVEAVTPPPAPGAERNSAQAAPVPETPVHPTTPETPVHPTTPETPVQTAPVAPPPLQPQTAAAPPLQPQTAAPPPLQPQVAAPLETTPEQQVAPPQVATDRFIDPNDRDNTAVAMAAEADRWAAHRAKAAQAAAMPATMAGVAEIVRPTATPNPAAIPVNGQGAPSTVNPNFRPPTR